MTNERACANDEPRPVTNWENDEVRGDALCDQDLLDNRLRRARELRARQADYLDSLPRELPEVVRQARKLMRHNSGAYPEGFEMALHLSHALEVMVRHEETDAPGRPREAALYLAMELSLAMHRAALALDRISDVLGNPGRLEREAEIAKNLARFESTRTNLLTKSTGLATPKL